MDDFHLSDETMARLLSDGLTVEESAAGEVHLRVCPDCRGKLDELTTTTPALAALLSPPEMLPDSLSTAPPGLELLGVLGVGKTAAVYRARQSKLGRIVALKFLCGGWSSAAEAQRRFQAEIEAAASQNHPHIVQVFEVGIHQGRPFLMMEYCGGGSLAERLRDGPLPPRQAAALIEVLARALHSVHSNGFVHRDLKPANILFDGEGRPKLADFGVVKRLDEASTPTPVGSLLGTPPYLAPEQIDGSTAAGSPCDVYALGAILYECLIGRPPFRADSIADTLFDVLSREPMSPRLADPRLPRDLETICLKCLEKEPTRRYGSALELADDLHRYLNGQAVRARPVRILGRTWRWLWRNPLPAALTAALMLAVLGGLALCGRFWYQAVASRQETENARREAEENFLRTRRLLPDLVTAGGGPAQLGAQRRRVRRGTLERACSLYRELCSARPNEGELRSELAQVLTALAEVERIEGRYEASAAASGEALALWRRLREEEPQEPRWRKGAASALWHLATACNLLGRSREMADAFREAIALYQALTDEQPSEDGLLMESIAVRSQFTGAMFGEAKIDQSISLLEECRRQLESRRAAGFDSVELRLSLVGTLCRLGQHYQLRGDSQSAIRCWRAARQHSAGLDAALPRDASALYLTTACGLWLPRGDSDALTPAQAIPRLEKAMQNLEIAYAMDAESNWATISEAGRCLADCYLDAGRPADALRMERRVAEALPPRPDGFALRELVRIEGTACVARRERQAGQPEAARRHAQEAADGFVAFCRGHASDAASLDSAIDFCPRIAPPLRHSGCVDQSRRVAESALQIVQQRVSVKAGAAQLRRLAEMWLQVARCRMIDDYDGVEAALRAAVDAARRLVALTPEHRYLLDNRLRRLAECLGERGRGSEAAACLRECECLWVRDADGLRGVACYFRNLAKDLKPRQTVPSSEEEAERAGYLAEAVRLEKAADALRR